MMYKKWRGSYKYNNNTLQQMAGSNHTNFKIEITFSQDNNFVGKVLDDPITGGTVGVGEVKGTIAGDKIEFIKRMPVLTVVGSGGFLPVQKKRHRDVHYTGIVSSDGKSMSGEWRFKFGVGFIGILPVVFFPTSGTWSMNADVT